MIFTSKQGQHVELDGLRQPPKKPMNLYTTRRTVKAQSISPTTVTRIAPSDGDRMTWGAPTWTFFHVLPEKLSNKNFIKNKDGIIRLITTICNNLPCPSCSQHARQYMQRVNFNAINTVEDLRKMLYIFHNSVNERKKYAKFEYDDLIEKYSNLDFNQVVNNFMSHFQKKVYAMNLIAQQISRQKQVTVVKKWLIDNMHLFQ